MNIKKKDEDWQTVIKKLLPEEKRVELCQLYNILTSKKDADDSLIDKLILVDAACVAISYKLADIIKRSYQNMFITFDYILITDSLQKLQKISLEYAFVHPRDVLCESVVCVGISNTLLTQHAESFSSN